MAGLQSGEDRMMIDSVVWAKYVSVTDTHTHTHSHVATAVAALTHCVLAAEFPQSPGFVSCYDIRPCRSRLLMSYSAEADAGRRTLRGRAFVSRSTRN